MVKLQTVVTLLLHLLLISSIATVSSRPIILSRRGLSANCDPLFEACGDQWPFSPITSSNPFISRPFLRRRTPPHLFSPPSVVVPSPPPPVFTNPSFTQPPDDTNFSPLVASPPPPGYTIPSVFPNLPPPDGDTDTNASPPFLAVSFSPPADSNLPPEVTLPPIAGKSQPDVFMSPPQQKWPAPDVFNNVPPPPLVAIDDSQPPEDAGQLPLQQPEETIMPPPVDENAIMGSQLPPMGVESPPSA